MSKLIAFRMPDALIEPFEKWCEAEGVSATSALVRLLWQQLGEPVSVTDGHGKPKKLPKRATVAAAGYDALTGEALKPRGAYQKQGKK
jgi:hypothetical protein